MIITRTPLRVSFAGGGTDLPEYFEKYGLGCALSCTINKYVTVMVHQRTDSKVRVNAAGATEEVSSADHLKHPIVYAALRHVGIKHGVEVTSVSDVIGGNGLGSSSAFTVGLYYALARLRGWSPNADQVVQESYRIERDLCEKPVGWQDHASAVYGGLRLYRFKVGAPPTVFRRLETHAIRYDFRLYDLGSRRSASDVLHSYSFDGAHTHLGASADEAYKSYLKLAEVVAPRNHLHAAINNSWRAKKQLSRMVSDSPIDTAVRSAMKSGAQSAKVLGAGGGGFLLVGGSSDPPDGCESELEFEFVDHGTAEIKGTHALNK
jgi:D-glycero-alpha-D-manno-heptose-7-phosphate kinase